MLAPMSCPSCGAPVAVGARFCASCGHALHSRSDERRIATVLFADLVGFTTMSETADPEQVKNLVDACFQLLARDITSFGGQVDKIVGDAIIALFGAPVAHEDDAERAVRAALRMQETMQVYRAETEAPVHLRIGVNTGEVLVGALRAGGDYTAMGDVVNTAQRLETVATPGTVVVGPSTYGATHESVAYQSLGSVEVKGRDEPVDAWEAIEALLPPGHRPHRPQTPFVGRDSEMGVLGNAVDAAVARRRAHLLLLIGEAGVGKSRLAEEAAERARCRHDALVLEGRCVPYGEANVWWPIAEALRDACGVAPDATLSEAGAQCADAVASALAMTSDSAEVQRVTTGLLYLMGYEVPLREIDPQRAREEATRAVLTFLERATFERPVVMVLSDLHWADHLVLDLVATLVERLCRERFVLVATARPTVTERWVAPTGRHNTVLVNLDPLDSGAAGDLLDALVDADVPSPVRALLLDRSGGNPFFLEELVALIGDVDLAESDLLGGSATLGELPDTLRGLVAARIDSLAPAERGSLEDASVWGRTGPVKALATMAEVMRGITDIEPVLDGLVANEIIEVDGEHWSFRSDLIREVAYSTLTKADRARRHHGIAAYLSSTVESGQEAPERLVDMVAFHFGAAADLVAEVGEVSHVPPDVTDQALDWLEEAARRAEVAQALPVAERLYSQALRLLGLEPTARRAHLLLGRAAVCAQRRAMEEARADVEAAHELAVGLGDEAVLARSLLVRGEVERDDGDLGAAVATLEKAVEHFHSVGDERGAANAMREIGMSRIFLGENDQAEVAIRAALAGSKAIGDRRGAAWALQHLAWISFIEGRADEAEDRLTRSAETFAELGDVGGLGWALGLLAYVCFIQGDLARAEELGAQVLVEARERGDRWGEGMMLLLSSGVRCWTGRTSEALDFARQAHALFHAIGDRFGQAQALTSLGRVLVSVGRVDEGLTMLRDGLEASFADPLSQESVTLVTGLANVAVHLGQARLALDAFDQLAQHEVAHMGNGLGAGALEREVARGLALLQSGRVAEAVVVLRREATEASDLAPSTYVRSSLALALAAAGERDEVLQLEHDVLATAYRTYLDAMAVSIASALVKARDCDVDAATALDATIEAVDATDDLVAQAVVRLARAALLDAIGAADAAAAGDEAELRLRELGIAAEGWRSIFRQVLAPTAAAV
jgi:class 3 adenylate cyclase/tetratricopeptide (TPR) repeat protein